MDIHHAETEDHQAENIPVNCHAFHSLVFIMGTKNGMDDILPFQSLISILTQG
jgi:hypothetical protein